MVVAAVARPHAYFAAYVYFDGVINDYGYSVRSADYAVCPALWIDLESEI